jgi:hypothetical protein
LQIRSLFVCSVLVTLACVPGEGTTTGIPSSSSDEGSDTGTTATSQGTSTSSSSDDTADSSGSTGPVSPPDCSDYMGSATPEQTATTPLANAEAELLAIEASGEIVAPPALHDRVVTELAAIRTDEPGLLAIEASPTWPPSSIVVSLDEEGAAAYDAGTYHGWDCPNALYDVTETDDSGLFGTIIVQFDGLYDVRQVIEDYMVLEHVVYAETDLIAGDSSDVCLSIDGDVHTYIFDDARGDCPAGCTEHVYTGFTVALDGTITPLGSFDPALPMPAPAWFEDADSCTMWL